MNALHTILHNVIFKGNTYIPRGYINVAAYYVLPAALILWLIVTSFGFGLDDALEGSGTAALILVSVILFVKPLATLLPQIGLFRTIVSLRRQLGVATLHVVLFHFLLYAGVNGSTMRVFWETLLQRGPLQYGAIALVMIVLLGVTSNKLSVRVLKRNWKRLHKLSYILLPFILLHVALVDEDLENVITGVVLFIAYYMLLFLARRKRMKDM